MCWYSFFSLFLRIQVDRFVELKRLPVKICGKLETRRYSAFSDFLGVFPHAQWFSAPVIATENLGGFVAMDSEKEF